MDQGHEELSFVNLLTLLTKLLVYIISFLSSLRDRVKLRYVSNLLRCTIEGTPSLWKEFVWPCYDSREECCVKEVLTVCGQHIKILSCPNCRVSSVLVKILSNIQHLSLPSTKLDFGQLRMAMHHMGCLQALELTVDTDSYIKQLLYITSHLRELSVHVKSDQHLVSFQFWKEAGFKPPRLNVVVPFFSSRCCVVDYVNCSSSLTAIPTGTIANFRLYDGSGKVPLNFSSTLPYFQLQFERSDQVTIPCVKLSDFGILGLNDDLACSDD